MKKLFTIALLFLALGVFAQPGDPSGDPDQPTIQLISMPTVGAMIYYHLKHWLGINQFYVRQPAIKPKRFGK